MKENYYDVLGVPGNATLLNIKKAYYDLARLYHPDKFKGKDLQEDEHNAVKFKEINCAFEVLSDQEKRKAYDRRLNRKLRRHKNEPVQFAGLITSPKKPLSDHFKQTHKNYSQQYQTNALSKKNDGKDDDDILESHSDIFIQLREKEQLSSDSFVGFNQKLNPTLAIEIFRNFLQGTYVGSDLTAVKSFLEKQISLQAVSADDDLLHFYQGIVEIISIVFDESKRKHLFVSLQKIIEYVKRSSQTFMVTHKPLFTLLIQDCHFRNLVAMGARQHWETPSATPLLDQLMSLFVSELDVQFKNDIEEEQNAYLHEVYRFQQYLQGQIKQPLTAALLRKLAFDCMDYIPILKDHKSVLLNLYLQSAFLFKKAAELEPYCHRQMADESLAMIFCVLASQEARKSHAFIDLYIHHNILKILHHFDYQHPNFSLIVSHLKSHALKLTAFFPYLQEIQSPLNLILSQTVHLKFMRDYLQNLLNIMTHNKQQPDNIIEIEYPYVDVLCCAFEASLQGWLDDTSGMTTEKNLYLDTMTALLDEKGWTFADVDQNLKSKWMSQNRDKNGWLRLTMESASPDEKNYKSFDGLEIDFDTGSIKFALTPVTAQETPVFSQYHLLEMLRLNVPAASMSLDNIDPERKYHPFQKINFKPSRMSDTELLHTMFIADYLLKFFTTGHEVQAQYPYDRRTMDVVIEKLPPHLKEIIHEFRQNCQESMINRFWFEASFVPTLLKDGSQTQQASTKKDEGKVSYTFGDIKMVVKKHRMELSSEGTLVDSKEDKEGWNIYLLTEAEYHEVVLKQRHLNAPAIINIVASNTYYFYENDMLSREPFLVELSPSLQEAMSHQVLDKHKCIQQIPADLLKKTGDNRHVIYHLVQEITSKAQKPHLFSPETVFAEKFTQHFDAFAQYFPELERLKQLSKISLAIQHLNRIRQGNHEKVNLLIIALEDSAHWKKEEERIHSLIFEDKKKSFAGITLDLNVKKSKDLEAQKTHFQTLRNQIGNLNSVDANSSEVSTACQKIYNDIHKDLTNKHGADTCKQLEGQIWPQVITPEIPKIIQQINTNKQNLRNQYKIQFTNAFKELGLPPATLNQLIEHFLNGHTQPLAEAMATQGYEKQRDHIKSELTKAFPKASSNDIELTLNGMPDALAKFVASTLVLEVIKEQKDLLREAIRKAQMLEDNFKLWQLGDPNLEISLNHRCYWVPASYHQEKYQVVYGGVLVIPTMLLQNQISYHSNKLTFPQISAFSDTSRYYDILNAKQFISNVEQKLGWISPYASPFFVKGMFAQLKQDINQAEFDVFKAQYRETTFSSRSSERPQGNMPPFNVFSKVNNADNNNYHPTLFSHQRSIALFSNHRLAEISCKYETSKKTLKEGAAIISSGIDDPGGKSYGLAQLASGINTLQTFLKNSSYGDHFKDLKLGSSQFDAKWVSLASSDEKFLEAQLTFIEKTHYQPLAEFALKQGLPKTLAINAALWSISVQHRRAKHIVEIAVKNHLTSADMNNEIAVVHALYNARIEYVKNLKNFKPINAVMKRYENERSDILSLRESSATLELK